MKTELKEEIKEGIKNIWITTALTAAYAASAITGIVIDNPYVQGNLNDVFLTGAWYFALKPFKLSKINTALSVMTLASFAETMQLMGYIDGTYDPKDFIAYGLGACLAVGLDKILEKRKEKKLESIVK